MKKIRLDLLLVERGLADSRSQAQRLVMAGQVRVDGQVELRSAAAISPQAAITIEAGPRYVSRGGEKLEAALQTFGVDIAGRVCADVGATYCCHPHTASDDLALTIGRGGLYLRAHHLRAFLLAQVPVVRSLAWLAGMICCAAITVLAVVPIG